MTMIIARWLRASNRWISRARYVAAGLFIAMIVLLVIAIRPIETSGPTVSQNSPQMERPITPTAPPVNKPVAPTPPTPQ